MPRHTITGHWSLELEDGAVRRPEGGDVMFWWPDRGRTVYAAVYATGNADAEEAIAAMLEGRPGVPRQTFDRVEPGLIGHAYLLPEGDDDWGPGAYWGLNTWTAAPGSVACVTFYFQELDDLDWALAAWRSICHGDPAAGATAAPGGDGGKCYAN